MLNRLRSLIGLQNAAGDLQRERLLSRFPKHLELIDSGEIPHEYSTGPDLSYYTESAEYYYNLIVESAPHLKDKPRAVTDIDREMASVANNRIVLPVELVILTRSNNSERIQT